MKLIDEIYEHWLAVESATEKIASATTPAERWILFGMAYRCFEQMPCGLALEIGVAWGKTTCLIAAAAAANGGRLAAVDIFEPYFDVGNVRAYIDISEPIKNLRKADLHDYVTLVKGRSNQVDRWFHGELSFAFIDGCHEHGAVLEDAGMAWRNINRGHGIIAFHDVQCHASVKAAFADIETAEMAEGSIVERFSAAPNLVALNYGDANAVNEVRARWGE